jgi:Haem-binding domain
MNKKVALRSIAGLAVLFGAIQLIPYGHSHSDPPVRREPSWDSPRTRELAVRACYDCHSNQTLWPWWDSDLAPSSWLVERDVQDGRSRLNFSEWDRPQRDARPQAIDRRINSGSMPPWYYLLFHPDRRLTSSETDELRLGLDRTVTQDPPGRR